MTGKIQIIVGGQFGSEGKGAIAGYLATPGHMSGVLQVHTRDSRPFYAVRVAGPNAGHTVYGRCPDPTGHCSEDRVDANPHSERDSAHPWKLRAVPVAAVTNPNARLVIAAGSEIAPDVLNAELTELDRAGYNASNRITLDMHATKMELSYAIQEARADLTAKLGSTGKGIGAARVDRLWRTAELWGGTADTATLLNRALNHGAIVQIEGTQGYGLGLHTDFYPFCTSSDCRAIDFLAMAGISPWGGMLVPHEIEVWVVARTYPIRVAGNSGPLQSETTWDDLGLSAERTTVTNKIRRVGFWDHDLVARALEANGGLTSPSVNLALTMIDQIDSESYGAVKWDQLGDLARSWISDQIEGELGTTPGLVGTSPTTVVDLR